MLEQELETTPPAGDGALHRWLLAAREHDRAYEAHDPRYFRDHDRDEDDGEARPRECDQRDGEQDRRYRHDAVHDAHDDAIDGSEVAADEADREADGARRQRDGDPHDQRDPGAVDRAGIDVAAELVGAEPPRFRWRAQA